MTGSLRVLLPTLCALLLAAAAPTAAQEPQASASAYRYYRFTPAVIFADGVDSTTLEVFTAGADIASVEVNWNNTYRRMYDDGTHGDGVARDGVYTLNGLARAFPPGHRLNFEGKHTIWGCRVKIVKTGGSEETASDPTVGFVLPDARFPTIDLGGGLSATRSAFFIVDSGGQIFPNMPLVPLYCGKPFPAAFQKLYSVFPDAFDFGIVMPNHKLFDPETYRENVPYYVAVKNDVQHIGMAIFNETAGFFSRGRLRGMIYHSWGYGAILDHEIGHAWGVLAGYGLGMVYETPRPTRAGHWAGWVDVDGQMSWPAEAGGSLLGTLASNGDGTWRVHPDIEGTRPYTPLELYVMGLIPPSQVPPVHLLVNPNYSNPQRITAQRVVTITIDQIMAAEGGPRVPAYPAAQKDFTAAFIVVSDRAFTAAERAFHTLDAEFFASDRPGTWYMTPFKAGTGGRGSLSVRLPVQGFHDVYLPVTRRGS